MAKEKECSVCGKPALYAKGGFGLLQYFCPKHKPTDADDFVPVISNIKVKENAGA